MEQETFWTLLHDSAHWEFELFVTLVFDLIVGGMCWPYVKRHWKHHVDRDIKEGIKYNAKKRKHRNGNN